MNEPRAKILIIDDEEALRNSFAYYLEDLGYQILTAENGRVGLDLFDPDTIDLVLVDLRMPEVDGLEVLGLVTETAPDTPMIVISGTGVISDAVEALHKGAWDYLLKPVENLTILAHAVENALEKSRLKRENREYQRHLEQMVASRTRELKNANNHLTHINTRLRRIVDTTRTLSFCSEVEKFGSLLLEEFGEHMLASGGSLYLREKHGLRLVHTLDYGHAPHFIPFPIEQDSVFKEVMDQKKPALIKNINTDANFKSSGWENYPDGSALVFPLPDEVGEITGILTLHSKNPPPFVEQDKEIGTILASYSCEALRAVRATESLRESEQQFRMILDNIRTGIIIVDAESRNIVYANPTAVEMAGSSAGRIIDSRCHNSLCPNDEGLCPVLDLDRDVDSSERILKTIDGREIPILKTTTRTIYNGKDSLLESFIDLTAQKKADAEKAALETQLRQAQKMEALGTLAGGIAHDFNNILSAVIGYAELGSLELEDPSHPLTDKLESILHAGNRAKDLVAQILTFSRMQEQILTPVRIAPVVKEALKLLEASLPADIQLKHQITTRQQVLADPTQIHQIVMNLCTNAYHAMEKKGGVLAVSLAPIAKDDMARLPQVDLPPGSYLHLCVADTGTGISAAVLDRIFDPYFSTKNKNKGTGLGLAVVHGIVKSHSGAIAVESRLGKGTTFHVLLPTTEETMHAEKGAKTNLPRGHGENILFIDDEQELVNIGCEMLTKLGYNATGVVGGLKGLETYLISPDDFDLVITDLSMPNLTGDRLARKIIDIRPDLPIILSTGFSERLDRKRLSALGVRKFIMKPLAMNILAESVHRILNTT